MCRHMAPFLSFGMSFVIVLLKRIFTIMEQTFLHFERNIL
nr:MAG TPA: hypothetical protein [Caudoviricetes sp.]